MNSKISGKLASAPCTSRTLVKTLGLTLNAVAFAACFGGTIFGQQVNAASAEHGLVSLITGGRTQIGIINTASEQSAGYVGVISARNKELEFGIAVMADGIHAYSSNAPSSSEISYIDLKTGETITSVAVPIEVFAMQLNPNGSQLFLVGHNAATEFDTACAINTSTNVLGNCTAFPGLVSILDDDYQFGFSADGSQVYFPSGGASPEVFVVDSITGTIVATNSLPMPVLGFAVAQNSDVVAISGQNSDGDAVLTILNTTTFAVVQQTTLPGSSCGGQTAIAPDGSMAYLLVGSDCVDGALVPEAIATLDAINIASGLVTAQSPTRESSWQLLLSADGSTLFVGEVSGVAALSTPTLASTGFFPQLGPVNGLGISPSGATVCALSTTLATFSYERALPARSGNTFAIGSDGEGTSINYIATSTDTARSFASSSDNSIVVFDNRNEKVETYLSVKESPSLIAAYSAAGPLYTVGSSGTTGMPDLLSTLDISDGRQIQYVEIPGSIHKGMAISPNGEQVWITGNVPTSGAAVYDAGTLGFIGSVAITGASSLAFSPDSADVYVGTEEVPASVVDISTETHEILRTIALPTGGAESITVSPDGSTLYVLANQSMLAIDAQSGAILRTTTVGTFEFNPPLLSAISPDGSEIYVADFTNLVVYETSSGTVSATVPYPAAISGVGFTIY